MKNLTIALAQIDIALGETQRNFETVLSNIAQAKAKGADLIVLPELWSTAYDLEHGSQHASPLLEGMFAQIAGAARQHQIAIAGSLLESRNGVIYNTATLANALGDEVGVYRKLHLVPMLDEDKFLARGSEMPVFDASGVRCALAICYDLRFPELWRRYALSGASLVILPSEWPVKRISHWLTLLPARAIENQFFIAATNRVGVSKGETFGGHSMICNPWGDILVEGDDQAALLIAQIDLDEIAHARERVPVFRDRRPDVYG